MTERNCEECEQFQEKSIKLYNCKANNMAKFSLNVFKYIHAMQLAGVTLMVTDTPVLIPPS